MGEANPDAAVPAAGSRDPLWDDWETPPRVPGVPELHLDGYDGPLDALLDLAERQRIDLGRLSIVALADQFVAAMERLARHVPIERRADWLVLATRLVLLRSRLLFPANAAAQRDGERAVARLETMRLVRAAAAWLQARPQLGHDVFARANRGLDPRVAAYMGLMAGCLAVLRGHEAAVADPEPVSTPPRTELFRIPAALVRLRAKLAGLTEPVALETLLPPMPASVGDRGLVARSALSSTFVAALELTRAGEANVTQREDFGTICVVSAAVAVSESDDPAA